MKQRGSMPTHKTAADGINEQEVASHLEQTFGWEVLLSENPYETYDYFILDQNGVDLAVAELKRHHSDSTYYPTAVISKSKIDRLNDVGDLYRLPVILIFWFDDGLFWIPTFDAAKAEVRELRRRKPRESGKVGAHDTEPGYFIPIDWLSDVAVLGDFIGSE